ncbi:MAG: hypothetical protein EXR35_06475 [Limnohabitans sp.]|nr:hypothetical protein [Limnohabitans sp.]
MPFAQLIQFLNARLTYTMVDDVSWSAKEMRITGATLQIDELKKLNQQWFVNHKNNAIDIQLNKSEWRRYGEAFALMMPFDVSSTLISTQQRKANQSL